MTSFDTEIVCVAPSSVTAISAWFAVLPASFERTGFFSRPGWALCEKGLAGGIIHIFNHAMAKAALFMAIGCVITRVGCTTVADLAGLGRQMPVTMGAMMIGALSLIGIPTTVGFVTKWYLIEGSFENGNWLAVATILVSGLLAIIYSWRIVEAAISRIRLKAGAPSAKRRSPCRCRCCCSPLPASSSGSAPPGPWTSPCRQPMR